MKRRPLMAGNWKMYKTPAETAAFFTQFLPLVGKVIDRDIVICPPFVDLAASVRAASGTNVEIGAQNLHWAKDGAYTGEISAGMLIAACCRWVIIAHSERRKFFGETEESAFKKLCAALEAGLRPIYCVGEHLGDREAGRTEEVLSRQIRGCACKLAPDQFQQIAIAYEPVWAIGTGRVATPAIAAEAHSCIRTLVAGTFGSAAADACRILYGGSVKPDNIAGLMEQEQIDGALVGGASLDPASFASIVNF